MHAAEIGGEYGDLTHGNLWAGAETDKVFRLLKLISFGKFQSTDYSDCPHEQYGGAGRWTRDWGANDGYSVVRVY